MVDRQEDRLVGRRQGGGERLEFAVVDPGGHACPGAFADIDLPAEVEQAFTFGGQIGH